MKRALFCIFIILICFVAAYVYKARSDWRQFVRAYESIAVGDSADRVSQIMGRPDDISKSADSGEEMWRYIHSRLYVGSGAGILFDNQGRVKQKRLYR